MTEQKKWYPYERFDRWEIRTDPNSDRGSSILSIPDMGEEQARTNAILCSKALEMKELLDETHKWLTGYMQTSGQYDRNSARLIRDNIEQLYK